MGKKKVLTEAEISLNALEQKCAQAKRFGYEYGISLGNDNFGKRACINDDRIIPLLEGYDYPEAQLIRDSWYKGYDSQL